MKFADLHLHTIFSDGTYTPDQIVDVSKREGLSCIAIADHDTVNAIEPAFLSAQVTEELEILPAVELSAEYDGLEIHILGYLIDYRDERLVKKLDFLREKRIKRIHKMVDKLRGLNINIEAGDVEKLAGEGTIGRLHLARLMLKNEYVNSVFEAFQRYIGDKSPAYICGFHFGPQEAIKLIKDIGGIAVLAHPYSINHDELIPLLLDYGLDGLEVYYPDYTPNQTVYYEHLAQKYNLLITGGSDFHGEAKPQVQIGSVKIPYKLVERLKEAKLRI